MGVTDPIRAEDPAGPEESAGPEASAQPKNPANPDSPTEPEKPADPDSSAQPEDPAGPDNPAKPAEPAEPADPAKPEDPAEEPAEPVEPAEPEEPAEEDPILMSISISSPPKKLVYVRGEDLDLGGLEISGTYSDGTSRIEEINPEYVSGYDKTKAAAQTITINIEGKTATFTITVCVTELYVGLGWPDDGNVVITGFPDGRILCSRTGNGGLVQECILNIEGYKLTECWVGGKKIKNSAQGFVINAAQYAVGTYSISCIGMKGDIPFSMELPFMVLE
jgi:hypothetical protein